jgi:hypothetical protein
VAPENLQRTVPALEVPAVTVGLKVKGAGAASRRDPRPVDVMGQCPGHSATESCQPAEPG